MIYSCFCKSGILVVGVHIEEESYHFGSTVGAAVFLGSPI